jgi:nucleoside-diphosphate-sugar epimerase
MIETARPILVTGATGFVGRQVVQQLCSDGYAVRALARRVPQQGFGPAVEVAIGDLNEPETYKGALDGVPAIVHAALNRDLSREPEATARLLREGVHAGIRKFVHLSTVAVYGSPPNGTITEETAPIPSPDSYASTKLAIEDSLLANSNGPEIAILRLGCVYGPGGGWWTKGLLDQMRRGKLILVNRGMGIANLIHVSDVGSIVALILRSATPPPTILNVTDGMPVPWSRYFAELEKVAGHPATVAMSAAEAREHGRRWLTPSLARRAIRKITRAPLIHPLDDRGINNFASVAVFSNHKATIALNFSPKYDLESGMRTVNAPPRVL